MQDRQMKSTLRYESDEILNCLPVEASKVDQPRTQLSPFIGHSNGLDSLARAAAYLERISGAGKGERNQTAFKVAAMLVRDFDLSDRDAFHLLSRWNDRNFPPLDEAELQGVLQSARRSANGEPGSKLIVYDQRMPPAIKPEPTTAETKLCPVSYRQLASDHPMLAEPIIDGLLRRGETANIIAASKVGKSWLVYLLLLSVVMGLDWLGKFPCRMGRVLLIDNELHPSNLASRIKTVAQAMGLQPEDYESALDIITLRGRLTDLVRLLVHLESIEPGEYDLIVFDAFYRGLPAGVSENDNGQVAMLYNAIDAAIERLRCAWVNIHHASKGSQTDKAVTDVGAGAGSQSRAADAHIVLRPHEEPGVVVLDAAVRSFAPIEPVALRWFFPLWQLADGLDTAKLKGRGGRREEIQAEKDREGIQLIRKGFTKLGEKPATFSSISREAGMSKERAKRLLNVMHFNKEVTYTETTVKGNDCHIWTLLEASLEDVVD